MNGKEALQQLLRKMDGAYWSRHDYPPYALMSWDDRVRYDAYIRKLIAETMVEAA